ncbi:hypothetical protein [Corynebacterium sp. 335C]
MDGQHPQSAFGSAAEHAPRMETIERRTRRALRHLPSLALFLGCVAGIVIAAAISIATGIDPDTPVPFFSMLAGSLAAGWILAIWLVLGIVLVFRGWAMLRLARRAGVPAHELAWALGAVRYES